VTRADASTVARVRRLYSERGYSVAAICKRTGLTERQVYYHLRDLPKRVKWDCTEVAATVVSLTRKLKRPPSLAELGKRLGVTRSRAHVILRTCQIDKPRAPGLALSFAERLKRQAVAARKTKRRTAMMQRKIKRDLRIIAMRKSGKSRDVIAEALGIHVNTVGNVLRSAGRS
jgi:DNA-binding CsgD family transcriptional regulator